MKHTNQRARVCAIISHVAGVHISTSHIQKLVFLLVLHFRTWLRLLSSEWKMHPLIDECMGVFSQHNPRRPVSIRDPWVRLITCQNTAQQIHSAIGMIFPVTITEPSGTRTTRKNGRNMVLMLQKDLMVNGNKPADYTAFLCGTSGGCDLWSTQPQCDNTVRWLGSSQSQLIWVNAMPFQWQGRLRAYLHMVYVTHTEAPRKEGKQRRVMKMVVIWLTLYGFLGAWQFIITLLCVEKHNTKVRGHRFCPHCQKWENDTGKNMTKAEQHWV